MPEYIDINENHREEYNKLITHPLQSYEWGEFRKKTGVTVLRKGLLEGGKLREVFTLTLHPVPRTAFTIGYLPKGDMPTQELIKALIAIGKIYNCIFIQLEPNILNSEKSQSAITKLGLVPSHHPLFTRYTFTLDLDQSEDELMRGMHQKTRYNIRVAIKKGVTVVEDNSQKAFKAYLKLTDETTERQKFYAHSHGYHQKQWETLPHVVSPHTLSSHLLTARFEDETLAAWIVFICNGVLYYPYGASSSAHKDKMASNLIMWEAIKFGKRMGCHSFDMWGALEKDSDKTDPWYGFHRFKQNYGATHTEFVGSYDLVLNPMLYALYKRVDTVRWMILKLKKQIFR